jgi:protein deglycase
MPRAIVPLADGVEEMEAVIIIDVLRRAQWDVVAAGMKPGTVTASRGVVIQPDAGWESVDLASFDALVIPGGKRGTDALRTDTRVLSAVQGFVRGGKLVGAVCAGPLVLQAAGVLHERRITCHPGVRSELCSGELAPARVVVDGNLVTSQGPGTTMEFALMLIRLLSGEKLAASVADGLILADPAAGNCAGGSRSRRRLAAPDAADAKSAKPPRNRGSIRSARARLGLAHHQLAALEFAAVQRLSGGVGLRS